MSPKATESVLEENGRFMSSQPEVKMRKGRKREKRSSVILPDKKSSDLPDMKCLSRKYEFMSDTNLSEHLDVPQKTSVLLKQMSFASRSMPTIPALTLSICCPTLEETNVSQRISQTSIPPILETEKKTLKKKKMNQLFKTIYKSKQPEDGRCTSERQPDVSEL